MCGRFAITLPPEAVRAFFDYVEQPNFPPRYNIAPTQPIPIVFARAHTGGAERHFLLTRWGFLPGFVKDPKTFPLLINARAEGVGEKASFRAALRRRRCLVVADGFYEWRRAAEKGLRQPYLIRRVNGEPMGFAGLWETWMDATGGEIDTACIITTNRQPADVQRARAHARDPAARGVLALARHGPRRSGDRGRAADAGAGERAGTRADRNRGQPVRQRRRVRAGGGGGDGAGGAMNYSGKPKGLVSVRRSTPSASAA